MENRNIIEHSFSVDLEMRKKLLGQKPLLVWFTGLSGSGKSTLANQLEQSLYENGFNTYALDGDNIRGGLNKDLGFSLEDRKENIRRIGEVANLLMDAGLIVLSSFVSPLKEDRDAVKRLVGNENFLEVFVDCPLNICEQRDVKGLYKLARAGKIKDFTGISSPFEHPDNPDLIIASHEESIDVSVNRLLDKVKRHLSS